MVPCGTKVVMFGSNQSLWCVGLSWLTFMTYLETIRAKVVMFGIKPKLTKCRFELTYFYDLPTSLMTIGAKVVMFGIKPKFMKCRFEVYLLTYLKTLRVTPTSRKEDTWQNSTRVFDLTHFSRSQRSRFIWVRLPIIPQLQFKLCQLNARPLGLLSFYTEKWSWLDNQRPPAWC
jgi:hypothetical protein